MTTISLEKIEKVWRYIKSLEVNPLDGTVDIIYDDHYPKLQISEIELMNILRLFESKGFIVRNGYIGGAIIRFLK